MKKVCLIYANCQNKLIAEYLHRSDIFCREYLVHCFPVHNLIEQQSTIPEELLGQTDLFIYQPVKEHHGDRSTQSILKKLSPDCQKISFPSLYFQGYFPQYCKNPHNRVIKPNYPYGIIPHGDANIISLLAENKTADEIVEILSDRDFYTPEFLLNNVNNTLNELAKRESSLSVKVSSFIRENYRKHHLFNTQNHPSDILGFYVVNQILELLNLPKLPDNLLTSNLNRSVLNKFQIPIYPSVAKHLQLEFVEEDTVYRHSSFSTNDMTFKKYINEYISLCGDFQNNAQSFYFESIVSTKKDRLKEAVERLNKAIAIEPDSATFYGELGAILNKQGDSKSAISAYKKAIALNPKWENFYQSLGQILFANNYLSEAIEVYERAIAIHPEYSQFYRLLGDIFMRQNKLSLAESNYLKAIELEPANAFNYRCMGDIFRKKKAWQEAIKYYYKAIDLSPKTEYFYRNLGNILTEQNKSDKAIDIYQQAVKMFKKNSDLHLNLGNLQLKKGNVNDALNAYQKSIELNPQQTEKVFQKLQAVLQLNSCIN